MIKKQVVLVIQNLRNISWNQKIVKVHSSNLQIYFNNHLLQKLQLQERIKIEYDK